MGGSRRTQPLPPHWRRTVRRIIERDGGICYICGRPGADTADHVIPVCEGGPDQDWNLKAAHENPCHAAKTAREANRHNPMAKPRRREPEPHPGVVAGGPGG